MNQTTLSWFEPGKYQTMWRTQVLCQNWVRKVVDDVWCAGSQDGQQTGHEQDLCNLVMVMIQRQQKSVTGPCRSSELNPLNG